jgi:hypothetical protein
VFAPFYLWFFPSLFLGRLPRLEVAGAIFWIYLLVGIAAVCLNLPTFIWAMYHASQNPRWAGFVGLLNIFLGVPLLWLVFKKWIRNAT